MLSAALHEPLTLQKALSLLLLSFFVRNVVEPAIQLAELQTQQPTLHGRRSVDTTKNVFCFLKGGREFCDIISIAERPLRNGLCIEY